MFYKPTQYVPGVDPVTQQRQTSIDFPVAESERHFGSRIKSRDGILRDNINSRIHQRRDSFLLREEYSRNN